MFYIRDNVYWSEDDVGILPQTSSSSAPNIRGRSKKKTYLVVYFRVYPFHKITNLNAIFLRVFSLTFLLPFFSLFWLFKNFSIFSFTSPPRIRAMNGDEITEKGKGYHCQAYVCNSVPNVFCEWDDKLFFGSVAQRVGNFSKLTRKSFQFLY